MGGGDNRGKEGRLDVASHPSIVGSASRRRWDVDRHAESTVGLGDIGLDGPPRPDPLQRAGHLRPHLRRRKHIGHAHSPLLCPCPFSECKHDAPDDLAAFNLARGTATPMQPIGQPFVLCLRFHL